MNILKDNHKIPYNCPECNAPLNPTVKQIKNQITINCKCGRSIQLIDESLSSGIKEANKTYEDILKKIKSGFSN